MKQGLLQLLPSFKEGDGVELGAEWLKVIQPMIWGVMRAILRAGKFGQILNGQNKKENRLN